MLTSRFGKYEIIETLGLGTVGKVYLAKDDVGRVVALKLVPQEFLRQFSNIEETNRQFHREVFLAQELQHRHIVTVLDAGEIEGTLYIASEFMRGGSLADVLQNGGALSEVHTLEIANQLLLALSEIHSKGLVHHDIRPENILFDESGMAKIADLGMIRPTNINRRSTINEPNCGFGSPFYLAPEQIHGEVEPDGRCDLYSLGIVIYECLCGYPPFQGPPLDLFQMHLTEPVPPIDAAGVRPPVGALVLDLLAKKPEERPQNTEEVLHRLRPLLPRPTRTLRAIDYQSMDTDVLPAAGSTVVDEASPLAPEVSKEIDLTPLEHDISQGMRRAKLVFSSPRGHQTLFLYSGTSLQMGRNALDQEGQDVCLRLRPASGNEHAIRRISGKHICLSIERDKIWLVDSSSGGTSVDGNAVAKGVPAELSSRSQVNIANVLDLLISKASSKIKYRVVGHGRVSQAPSVLIERPANGKEHKYALVPGVIQIALAEGVWRARKGQLEILSVNGVLWVRGGDIEAGKCRLLLAGSSLTVDGQAISVGEIQPQDQK